MRAAPDCALDDEIVTIRPQRACEHVGNGGLQAVERAGEVDGEDALPALDRDVRKGLERVETGAGDHDLDGSELRAHLVEGSVDGSAVGDVGLRGDRGGSGLAQVLGGPKRCVALQVEQADAVAPRREVPGDRQPHSRCRSGDHGDSTHRSHRSGCLRHVLGRDYAPGAGSFATMLSMRENTVPT